MFHRRSIKYNDTKKVPSILVQNYQEIKQKIWGEVKGRVAGASFSLSFYRISVMVSQFKCKVIVLISFM